MIEPYPKSISLRRTRNEEVGVPVIRGYHTKSFVTKNFVISDRQQGTYVGICLGVHIPSNGVGDAKVEIGFSLAPYRMQWKPIDKDVWLKFFNMCGSWSGTKPSIVLLQKMRDGMDDLPNGQVCFSINLNDDKSSGLDMKLYQSYIVEFLYDWQSTFTIFLKYHDRISNVDELVELKKTLHKLVDVSYLCREDKYAIQKAQAIEKLRKLEADLNGYADRLDKLYEDAADALNELSDKYGIEIDLNDNCCEKSIP
jgi:hypothetical protein